MSADIFASDGELLAGPNWHVCETWAGETFRWVEDDATVFVPSMRPLDQEVTIELEPGPSLGGEPLGLSVVEANGTILGTFMLRGRDVVSVVIPATQWPVMHELHLRVDSEIARFEADGRILSFRVFGISSRVVPPDIFPISSPFRIGAGWYTREQADRDVFRWANAGAEIDWLDEDAPTLTLEVEPGPAVLQGYGTLVVHDADEREILRRVIAGRETVEISRPGGPMPTTLRLDLLESGMPTLDDARVLKFRAFAVPAFGA